MSRSGGGLPFAILPLALELDMHHKLRCELMTFTIPEENIELTSHELPAWGPQVFPIAPGIGRLITKADPAILHLHGLWSSLSISALRFQKTHRMPVVVSPHGMLDPWALQNSGWKKKLAMMAFERKALKTASCLHALNDAEAEAIRSLGLRTPIAVIPNGIGKTTQRLDAPLDVLRQDHRRVLLFLGRIHPKKGISELIEAWAILCARSPELQKTWRLVVAGWDDGGHALSLKGRTIALGLEAHITFTGPLFGNDKGAALAQAAAFVLPSYSEGLPMTILEAWSYGLPVFMTDACNLPEAFEAGAAYRISTDPVGLAATLAEGLSAPSDLTCMGERGRMLTEERFAWSTVAKHWAELYSWLLHRGPKPDFVDE